MSGSIGRGAALCGCPIDALSGSSGTGCADVRETRSPRRIRPCTEARLRTEREGRRALQDMPHGRHRHAPRGDPMTGPCVATSSRCWCRSPCRCSRSRSAPCGRRSGRTRPASSVGVEERRLAGRRRLRAGLPPNLRARRLALAVAVTASASRARTSGREDARSSSCWSDREELLAHPAGRCSRRSTSRSG